MNELTMAMCAASDGCISHLGEQFYHDPTLKDTYGNTVAMISARCWCLYSLPE